jgi:hypothetical protein
MSEQLTGFQKGKFTKNETNVEKKLIMDSDKKNLIIQ